MKRLYQVGELLSARLDKIMGTEDKRNPFEPPPTPSDDVPAHSQHHLRRPRDGGEDGTGGKPASPLTAAMKGAVSSLMRSTTSTGGGLAGEFALPHAKDDKDLESGGDQSFAEYYAEAEQGADYGGGSLEEGSSAAAYEAYGPPGVYLPPGAVQLPLFYRDYVRGKFTSARLMAALDAHNPYVEPMQMQQLIVHPQDPSLREMGCVHVRNSNSTLLPRQFVLQGISFVHRPQVLLEEQLRRNIDATKSSFSSSSSSMTTPSSSADLREILKRKANDPVHLDLAYDPRLESRVSLGHLLGKGLEAVGGGVASEEALTNMEQQGSLGGGGLIPVYGFLPDTHTTFAVDVDNVLIMAAGPGVFARQMQGVPLPSVDADAYADGFVSPAEVPHVLGWIVNCTLCVVSSENVPLQCKLSVPGSQWTTLEHSALPVMPQWYGPSAADVISARSAWLQEQQRLAIEYLKSRTRSVFVKDFGLQPLARTQTWGLWLTGRDPDYLDKLVISETPPASRDADATVTLKRTLPLSVLLSHVAYPSPMWERNGTVTAELSHQVLHAIEERTAEHVRLPKKTWSRITKLAAPLMEVQAMEAVQLQVRRHDGKPWSSAEVEFHVYLRVHLRQTNVTSLLAPAPSSSSSSPPIPVVGTAAADLYLEDERQLLYPFLFTPETTAGNGSSSSDASPGATTPTTLPGPSLPSDTTPSEPIATQTRIDIVSEPTPA